MKIKYLLFTILCICYSCTQQEETEYQLPNPQPKVVKAHGYVVPKDSMAAPKVIKIDKSKLKVVKAGKPKVVATNTNIHKAGKPKIVKAGTPRIIKIGSDTFLLPKKVKATGKVVPCKMPKPVKAAPPVMKDNAIYNIHYLDKDQGLNSSYINCMLRDKRGNLWFGTNSGVSKYDGETFTHFTEEEGLISNPVSIIIEDKTGNLWFATNGGGVCKYDGKYFTYFTEKQGLISNYVTSIFEDKKGNIWFGTYEGVSKYEPSSTEGLLGTFTHFTKKEGLISNSVSSIIEDKTGNLWFGTNGGGVSKYTPVHSSSVGDGFFTHFTENEGLSNNSVSSIIEDKNGNLWFGTNGGGVCKYDRESFTHFTEKEGLISNSVSTIMEDKTENLWFGTFEGLSKYTPFASGRALEGLFTHFTEKEGLSSNSISTIIEDKAGNIWFSYSDGGVSIYNETSFNNFTKKEGLINNTVRSIMEDKMGNIWFGTYEGVSKYNGVSFSNYTEKEGLSNFPVLDIMEDKKGYFWFGTLHGVIKYDGETFTHFTEEEGLISNSVSSIIEDKTGNLWFGTFGGVSKYTPSPLGVDKEGIFTNYTENEGLSNNSVSSMIEDKTGKLWFGSYGGGVSKYTPAHSGSVGDGFFTHFTEKEGLSDNRIWSIIEDKMGNLWFGTYGGGVIKYDGESFTSFTEKEGLSNNIVKSIIEVPFERSVQTNLYFATEKGLSNFEYNNISTSRKISGQPYGPNDKTTIETHNVAQNEVNWVTLKKRDGLKADDFNNNAALIDSKGFGWWGTSKALTRLNIKDYKWPQTIPFMQMKELELNERFIDYRSLIDSIKDSLKIAGLDQMKFTSVEAFNNYPLNLVLPYNLNHLTFNFIAIDWAAPHKIQYQYMLVGLDKKWSELSHEHKADYRNIPFGKFTFKVRAIGVAGKWSNTFEYSFVINPPWWRTWWAYGLYIITVISCIFYYIKWREKLLIQRQLELEQTVDERTYELVEEKKIVEHQKELVEEKQKEILDSIEYAKRIQATILPSVRVVKKYLEDSFILYLPKDIVAGDFYWMESIQLADELISGLANEKSNTNNQLINTSANQLIYFAACDCTGHGVPGAMVSVVCHNALNKALKEFGKRTPSEILDKVAELVIEDFNKNAEDNDEIKDGMDASLCALDTDTGRLQWAGANNPLWLIRKGQALEETKSDKQPVGRSDERYPYTNHEFQLEKGDVIYLITDGYADQFGGEKNRKFQKKQLKELLFSMHQLPMDVQRNKLYDAFINWRGENEQVDDVCIIGVRI